MLACPADAQSQQDGTGPRTGYDNFLAVQVYAVGGGFIPFGTNSNVTGVDATVDPSNLLIANQSGIASAVKSASNPTSSSYGKYLSISSLQSKYGASSSRRNAVTGAFKKYNTTATVDVFHLRVVATITIGTAQKMFGTSWHVYLDNSTGAKTAFPVNTPKLPSGLSGNVDTVAGLGHVISSGSSGAF